MLTFQMRIVVVKTVIFLQILSAVTQKSDKKRTICRFKGLYALSKPCSTQAGTIVPAIKIAASTAEFQHVEYSWQE